MWWKLFLLFTLVPLAELILLLLLSYYTSIWVSILTVLISGIAGSLLAKWQGLQVLRRIREQFARGEIPGAAVIDGLLILVAGALLLTPGLITDAAGMALLIPPLRRWLKRGTAAWMRRKFNLKDSSDVVVGKSRIVNTRLVEPEEADRPE